MWFFVVVQETLVISCFLDLLNSEKKWGGDYNFMDYHWKGGFTESEAWFRIHYML